jgi:outer membrane protein W
MLLLPGSVWAQGFWDQFSYEGIRFSAIGVEAGAMWSNRLTTEPVGALRVDFGNFAPKVRVLLSATYFKGQFRQEEIDEFERQLEEIVDDPTVTIDVGTITWADYGLALDFHYLFEPGRRVRPYAGMGVGLHFRNGNGEAINGTIVERALDMVDIGIIGSLGFEIGLTKSLVLTADARGEATTELLTASVRGGLSYRIPRRESQ